MRVNPVTEDYWTTDMQGAGFILLLIAPTGQRLQGAASGGRALGVLSTSQRPAWGRV